MDHGIRAKVGEMADIAVGEIAESLKVILEGHPSELQVDAMIKVTCMLACMASAKQDPELEMRSSEAFYEIARRLAKSLLMDVLPMPRGEDFKVKIGEKVQAQMSMDPKKAEMIKDMLAEVRQALDGLADGKFENVDEAMQSIGAERADEDDIDAAEPKETLQ